MRIRKSPMALPLPRPQPKRFSSHLSSSASRSWTVFLEAKPSREASNGAARSAAGCLRCGPMTGPSPARSTITSAGTSGARTRYGGVRPARSTAPGRVQHSLLSIVACIQAHGYITPWTMNSGSQFRAPDFHDPASPVFAEEFRHDPPLGRGGQRHQDGGPIGDRVVLGRRPVGYHAPWALHLHRHAAPAGPWA